MEHILQSFIFACHLNGAAVHSCTSVSADGAPIAVLLNACHLYGAPFPSCTGGVNIAAGVEAHHKGALVGTVCQLK
jgi:hypothetical protein